MTEIKKVISELEHFIRLLKYTCEKHKDDIVPTGGTNISIMCHDIINNNERAIQIIKELQEQQSKKTQNAYESGRCEGYSEGYDKGIEDYEKNNQMAKEKIEMLLKVAESMAEVTGNEIEKARIDGQVRAYKEALAQFEEVNNEMA